MQDSSKEYVINRIYFAVKSFESNIGGIFNGNKLIFFDTLCEIACGGPFELSEYEIKKGSKIVTKKVKVVERTPENIYRAIFNSLVILPKLQIKTNSMKLWNIKSCNPNNLTKLQI